MINFGVNEQLTYHEIELDSSQFSEITDYSISPINWPSFLLTSNIPFKNVAAMKIIECQIPISWHEINSKMSTSGTITFTDVILGVTVPIVILVGSYDTGAQFATAFTTAINAAAVAAGSPNTYTVTYSSVTGNFTITRTAGANTWRISVSSNATFYTSWFWKAGMPIGYVSAISAASLVLPLHSCTPTYLYVNSTKLAPLFNTFIPRNQTFLTGNAGSKSFQIAKIPINAGRGQVIHWQDPDPQKWFDFDNPATITQADFFLTIGPTNIINELLDLNGCPFSLKLGVLTYDSGSVDKYVQGQKMSKPSMF
jgi:hypothetical protein